MDLKHYISSSLCRGIRVGEDLYIEGDINILEEFEKHKGKNRMQLTLYKVSQSDGGLDTESDSDD